MTQVVLIKSWHYVQESPDQLHSHKVNLMTDSRDLSHLSLTHLNY